MSFHHIYLFKHLTKLTTQHVFSTFKQSLAMLGVNKKLVHIFQTIGYTAGVRHRLLSNTNRILFARITLVFYVISKIIFTLFTVLSHIFIKKR